MPRLLQRFPFPAIMVFMIEYTFTPAADFRTAIDNLYTIVTLLRSKDGCPFDRAQTPKTSLSHSLMKLMSIFRHAMTKILRNAGRKSGMSS